MGLFILDYDHETDVREDIIQLLIDRVDSSTIKQCLRSTYLFKSEHDVLWWEAQIKNNLDLNFYLVAEVKLGDRVNQNGQQLYEIRKKCNPELQRSLEDIIERLTKGK